VFSGPFKLLSSMNVVAVKAVVAIGLLIVPNARASGQTLQLAEPLQEIFLDGLPRSRGTRSIGGAFLVGLRLDGRAHRFEPKAVRILLGDNVPKPDLLCVRILSRDGRYAARGQYKLAVASDPTPLLDFPTRYLERLKDYMTTDFAMIAVSGKSCDNLKQSHLFVVADGDATNARQLIVQLHTGDEPARVQLGRDNDLLGPAVPCDRPANGPTLGYTAECALRLPTGFHAGGYQLSIRETGSGGETTIKTYSLVLPTFAGREQK
jgi:hypothetical protein